jgi:hypothetical protein
LTLSSNPAASGNYTLYTYGFTATASFVSLAFAPTGDHGTGGNHYWLLDEVSVNHTNTNTNVIINGGFETGNLGGWTQYCNTTSNCNGTYYSHVVTTSCYSGTYCVSASCLNYDYLVQTFSTVIGDYYLVSYYLRIYNIGGNETIYVLVL